MTEPQKLPPCDACGAESRASPYGSQPYGIPRLCATCWKTPGGEVDAAIAARRAKQEPEFYGTMPAAERLPHRLPPGVRVESSHDLEILAYPFSETNPGYCCENGGACCWSPARILDWSRIPRQPKPPEAPVVATVQCDGMVGSRRCELPNGHVPPVHMVSDRVVEAVRMPVPDPYAAVRDADVASYYGTTRANERYAARRAALTLDLDRPSGKVKYPESWPEKFSGASYEDD